MKGFFEINHIILYRSQIIKNHTNNTAHMHAVFIIIHILDVFSHWRCKFTDLFLILMQKTQKLLLAYQNNRLIFFKQRENKVKRKFIIKTFQLFTSYFF